MNRILFVYSLNLTNFPGSNNQWRQVHMAAQISRNNIQEMLLHLDHLITVQPSDNNNKKLVNNLFLSIVILTACRSTLKFCHLEVCLPKGK